MIKKRFSPYVHIAGPKKPYAWNPNCIYHLNLHFQWDGFLLCFLHKFAPLSIFTSWTWGGGVFRLNSTLYVVERKEWQTPSNNVHPFKYAWVDIIKLCKGREWERPPKWLYGRKKMSLTIQNTEAHTAKTRRLHWKVKKNGGSYSKEWHGCW